MTLDGLPPTWDEALARVPAIEVALAGSASVGRPMQEIADDVIAGTDITMVDIRSDRKNRHLVWHRDEIFWRCARESRYSLAAIGRYFGRHHTSVMTAVERHQRALAETENTG